MSTARCTPRGTSEQQNPTEDTNQSGCDVVDLARHYIHRLSGAQGREGLWRLVDLAVPGQAPHTGFLERRVEKGYRRPTYSRCGMIDTEPDIWFGKNNRGHQSGCDVHKGRLLEQQTLTEDTN